MLDFIKQDCNIYTNYPTTTKLPQITDTENIKLNIKKS